MIKRLFDILVASAGLLALAPLLLTLAAIVKWSSPGPVFFRGMRVGQWGKPFRILKFRSMLPDAEQLGGPSTSNRDPRITRVGRFLRHYKLDELPQLWNVLLGDMSLVGPRPEVVRYTQQYTDEESVILGVRPGMTDWASIWNADEGAVLAEARDPDEGYEQCIRPTKLQLQLAYVREQCFWIDMKILACTLLKLVRKDWLPAKLATLESPRSLIRLLATVK